MPHPVRLRRADLRQRINGKLSVRYRATGLSSFSGLELMRQYVSQVGLAEMIRRHARRALPSCDFGRVSMVLLVLVLLITGGRRVRHIGYLEADPLVKRFCGLAQVPAVRAVGRWLGGFDHSGVEALLTLNEVLVGRVIRDSGVRRLTLDVDGSVVSTGLQVEGARRGYNPHRRKVPSYYPISAYESQTGQILRVHNRAGNVHDGKASLGFLQALFAQLDASLPRRPVLEMRMDGAFFRKEIVDLLESEGVEYAIKVPFYPWLGLKEPIAKRRRWRRVDGTVDCFDMRVAIATWERNVHVVVYRKRVAHRTPKNFQLDLFDPDDGYYEYSAVMTNKAVTGRTLWFFMCGRGSHEKVYAELKSGFAFDCVPTQRYQANSAWQVLSIMAFNVIRGFQARTIAEGRRTNRKRRTLRRFEQIHTLRYRFLNRAGLLVHPNGKATLDVGDNVMVRDRFETICRGLAKAA